MPETTAEKSTTHLNAYSVKEIGEGQDKRPIFTKVGAAFPNRDGQGYNVILDAVPVDGKIVLRAPKTNTEDTAET